MKKKKILLNLLMVIVLLALIVLIVFVYKSYDDKRKKEEADNVQLTEIGYGSSVSQVGYINASAIINNFINAYNNSNGEGLVSNMDLVATYIYSEYGEEQFDNKYVEILSNPSEYEDLIIMQYSLQQEEESLIKGIESDKVKLTLIENSEIEDKTKYLSKMTAKIQTIVETDGINTTADLEFLLLHKNKSYYIINYTQIESNE